MVQLHFMRGTPLMKLFDYYNNNASEGSFHLKNLKWWKVDLQENENWKSVNLSLSTDSLKLYRLWSKAARYDFFLREYSSVSGKNFVSYSSHYEKSKIDAYNFEWNFLQFQQILYFVVGPWWNNPGNFCAFNIWRISYLGNTYTLLQFRLLKPRGSVSGVKKHKFVPFL